MTEGVETSTNSEENEVIESIRWELNALSLNIKKESFKAKQELKAEIKRLWFYDWDENWENISFSISKVIEYLQWIKDKSWTDLDVKSSSLEKWVWTIAIQIAINYINKNWNFTTEIDLIDGIRGKQTWKWVKDFQAKYNLKNKDGLPWRETITKILELLGDGNSGSDSWKSNQWNSNNPVVNHWISDQWKADNQWNNLWKNEQWKTNNSENNPWKNKEWNGSNPENNSIESDKCIQLCENLDIQSDDGWNNLETDKWWDSFEDKLNTKLRDKWWLEWIIFGNPEIKNLLSNIVNRQWQTIQNMKKKYEKKLEEEKIRAQKEKNEELNENNEKPVKSWEEYKYEKFSQEIFEEFILSDEWIAVVVDEIKSHIDTSHQDKNGAYDKFYENYPISEKNLEIKLKSAWESKMKSSYYEEIYDEEKKEEMEKKDVLSNKIIGCVDKIIWDGMKSGNIDFNQEIIWELNWFISEWIDGIPINEIFSDLDQNDSFQEVLASKIKSYYFLVKNKKDINLNTGDKQINLQLKSYLFIYGCIFYSKFKSDKDIGYYERILPDVMRCIVSDDDASLINKIEHEEFLEEEKKQEEARKKRDLLRRIEIAKRNRELNNKIASGTRKKAWNRHITINHNSGDVNHQTWNQLARNINLDDYNTQTDLSEIAYNSDVKQLAFSRARGNFIKSNSIIKDFSPDDMRLIFDIETHRINEDARKEFLDKDIMKWRSQEEIDEIYKILSSFYAEYNQTLERIASGINKQEWLIDNEIKNSALWSVIDNVKSIFEDIVKKWEWNSKFEWFKFNEKEPVKREWNNIIISGTFNWTDTKVRYNLDSWELFMNSFFQHPSNSEIIFWKNSDANLKIWQLESFDTILDNHYNTPDLSFTSDTSIQNLWTLEQKTAQSRDPYSTMVQIKSQSIENLATIRWKYLEMLNGNYDMISNAIVDNSRKQNVINSTVTKFMKTFNIIPSSWNFDNLQFSAWSNLFDIVQIIEETGSPKKNNIQSLEYFNNEFMPTIMKYSCLEWWNNNLNWSQKNNENKDYYDDTFNDENKDIHISLIRENAKDFSQNLQKFKPWWTRNYDSDYQLWFAGFIKDNFVEWNQPDWTLDISKMKDFVDNLRDKDKKDNENAWNNTDYIG